MTLIIDPVSNLTSTTKHSLAGFRLVELTNEQKTDSRYFYNTMRNFRQDPENEMLQRQVRLAKIRIIEEVADSAAEIKSFQKAIVKRLDAILEATSKMEDRLSALEQQAAESPVEPEIELEKKETKKKK